MTRPAGAYAWLNGEPGPRMLLEALKLFGTLETPGAPDNPVILAWADEVKAAVSTPYTRWAADWYNDDAIPWCGLFMAVIACRANLERRAERWPPDKYLAAASWASWGRPIPLAQAALGDVLVFVRKGGNHVGQYVGEDAGAFHVLGANQSDTVNVMRIDKRRATHCRRPAYLNTPANVRKVRLASSGAPLSRNEA